MTNDLNKVTSMKEFMDIGFIVFYLIDIFTIILISADVTKEAQCTGELIHDVFALNNMDIRLKKSVIYAFIFADMNSIKNFNFFFFKG